MERLTTAAPLHLANSRRVRRQYYTAAARFFKCEAQSGSDELDGSIFYIVNPLGSQYDTQRIRLFQRKYPVLESLRGRESGRRNDWARVIPL